MLPLGLGHFTFLDLAPAKLVRLARQTGFDFVGLRFHPVSDGQLHYLPNTQEVGELSRVMAGEGITLYDIETVVIDAELDPSSLLPALDAAAQLGAKRVNTCADLFDELPETFARICALADERGLGVDIECMAWRGINTPQACLTLIENSGAANVGYLVDTLHHSRCGGHPNDISSWDPKRIVSAQICDAPLTAPQGKSALITEARGGRLLPGDGGLALSQIIAALPQNTVISVELPSATDSRPAPERARAIYQATAKFFEQDTR